MIPYYTPSHRPSSRKLDMIRYVSYINNETDLKTFQGVMRMNMGERLRQLRRQRHLSQEEVARHIGITRSAYSHYEINNRQPVYETLIKLAAFYDVSLDYIIGGTVAPCKPPLADPHETRRIWQLLQHMDQEQRQQSIRLLNELLRPEDSDTDVH